MGKEQHENSNQSHGEFQREEAMPGNVLRIQDLWWLSLNDRDADGWALMLAGRGRGGCCILQAARGHGVAAGSPVPWPGSQQRGRSWKEPEVSLLQLMGSTLTFPQRQGAYGPQDTVIKSQLAS